jgi:hypothetical protein
MEFAPSVGIAARRYLLNHLLSHTLFPLLGDDRDFQDRGEHFHLENSCIAKPEATRVRHIIALQALSGVGALAVFISPALLCVRKGSSSSAF